MAYSESSGPFSIGEGAVDIINAILLFVLSCYKIIKAARKIGKLKDKELPFTDKVITGIRILSAISILPLCVLECIAASQILEKIWLSSFLIAFVFILIVELILIDFKKLVWNENRKSNNDRLKAVVTAMGGGNSPQEAMVTVIAKEKLDSAKPHIEQKKKRSKQDDSDTDEND